MSLRTVSVFGAAEDRELFGFSGAFDRIEAWPATGPDSDRPSDVAVSLRGAPVSPAHRGIRVRFVAGGADGRTTRTIAQSGPALWRTAPFPVNDAVFEMPAAHDQAVLVVGGEMGLREDVISKLERTELRAAGCHGLTLPDLTEASVVVMLGDPGSTLAEPIPLPAEAPAVQAAGRILVTGRCVPTFGFVENSDHLQADTPDKIAVAVAGALKYQVEFERIRIWARRRAEIHRASSVYRALLEDLALEIEAEKRRDLAFRPA